MPSLLELTPAEFYILAGAPDTYIDRAVMLTMKDLSLKDVIDIRVEKNETRSNRTRTVVNVYPYTHFRSYRYTGAEKIFMSPFGNGDRTMPLYSYLRNIYQQIPDEPVYGRELRSRVLLSYFRTINWSWYKLSPKLNKKGILLKKSLYLELNNRIDELIKCLEDDPAKAYEQMKDLQGFIYFAGDNRMNKLNSVLANKHESIQKAGYSKPIYEWFLEMEKIKDFDGYFNQAIKGLNEGSSVRGRSRTRF